MIDYRCAKLTREEALADLQGVDFALGALSMFERLCGEITQEYTLVDDEHNPLLQVVTAQSGWLINLGDRGRTSQVVVPLEMIPALHWLLT